jgi:hypothetical protein
VPVSIVSIFCNHENLNFDYLFFSITMELFNKALFLSQQKIFALTHRRVFTLMVNLIQIINQFVLLFRKNVIEKSSIIWRVLPLVKIKHTYFRNTLYTDRSRSFGSVYVTKRSKRVKQ